MVELPVLLFLLLLIVSATINFVQYGRNVIATRRLYEKTRQNLKEREATSEILRISGVAVRSGGEQSDELAFLSFFVEYVARALQGSGAAVFTINPDETFQGSAVAGIFPPVREVSPQLEQKLLSSSKHHTDCIRGSSTTFNVTTIREAVSELGYGFYKNNAPAWLPKRFGELTRRVLVAPIYRNKRIEACVIVVSGDDFDAHSLTNEDGEYLVRLNELASLSIDGIRIFREHQKYEEELQAAKEEGMLQVSTGIIHNIGNAVTVAKLSVHELQEKYKEKEDRPEKLLKSIVVPKMREEFGSGNLQSFLAEDPAGSQYFEVMEQLLDHLITSEDNNRTLLVSLNDKLYHISEIIDLQQRFVGELGTENLTPLTTPLKSAIKIYEETINKKGIKIKTDLPEVSPEALIDTSMMTQVFINLIKNASEAMALVEEREPQLEIALYTDKSDVTVKIKDNGPGIPAEVAAKIFSFGFSTKSKDKASRGFGLHNCKKTVEKYGGKISFETEAGKGTTFLVQLPIRSNEPMIG